MRLGGKRSVAGAINRITRGRVQKELDLNMEFDRPVKLGSICVTNGDVLPCRLILHLSTHGSMSEMFQAAEKIQENESIHFKLEQIVLNSICLGLKNVLQRCELENIRSVAIPLFGTGTLGLPSGLVIEVILGTLLNLLRSHEYPQLELIQLVTISDSTFYILQKQIRELPGEFQLDESSHQDEFSQSIARTNKKHLEFLQMEASQSIGDLSFSGKARYLKSSFNSKEESKGEMEALCHENERLRHENNELRELVRKLIEEEEKKNLGWNSPNLPTPLAYAQNLVRSESDPNLRHNNLMSAIGIVTKYFTAIACAEYDSAGFFRESLNQRLLNKFRQGPMTDGSWNWVGRELAKVFFDSGIQASVVREFPGAWIDGQSNWATLTEALRELVNRRNEIHDSVRADPARARDWILRTMPIWQQMCEASSALTEYELIFVDRIESFVAEHNILYSIRRLQGEFFVPQAQKFVSSQRLQPEQLYLKGPDPSKLLTLNPFMTYEYSTITHNREAYCLDSIQESRFQFRAFRYAHKHYLPHEDQFPFTVNQ